MERAKTTINSYVITNNVILVDLLLNGDHRIFNKPLTIITTILKNWLNGDLIIMQQGLLLDYVVEQDQTKSRLVYGAMPSDGAISIVFEAGHPLTGDLDYDGDVNMADFSVSAAHGLV